MRPHLTPALLLFPVLTAALSIIGCDDYSAGHMSDPPGPLRLVHVMVQDSPASVSLTVAAGGTTRGGAVDLLDDNPPVACSDTVPCQVLLASQGGLADFTCRNGFCNDPLKLLATGVPVNPDIPAVAAAPAMPAMGCTPASPATMASPAVPGMSIRLVFNKPLDATLITTADSNMSLLPGIVDLIEESTRTAFPQNQLNGVWDPAGVPDFISDPLLLPFGPAIQISPGGCVTRSGMPAPSCLKHNAKYSVVIHPGLLKDRSGNLLADKYGNPITNDVKLSFVTENVGANVLVGSFRAAGPYQLPGDFTPVFGSPPTLWASDVLQLAFYSNVDLGSFSFTIKDANGQLLNTVEKYFDSPKDPSGITNTCPQSLASTTQIDLFNTTGTPGAPAPWPIGTYKLSFTVNSPDANTNPFNSAQWPGADGDGNLSFTVVAPPAGSSSAGDLNSIDRHPFPEQMCPCM